MCGIAGYWAVSSTDLARAPFGAFVSLLGHRGPDGTGVEHFAAERLWLGHRRLAIVDPTPAGRQPMSYGAGRYWLSFNGEIYNFLELREELHGLGYTFRSDTDSEVVLAAYAAWGPRCQLKFNGMWALAIWDCRDRTLFLSRDRFGVKPLHYRHHNGTFSFASELKAFLALPDVDGSFDEAVLAETLVNINGQEGTEHTLLPQVKRLPGGCSLTVGADGTAHLDRWWSTADHLAPVPGGQREQTTQFLELFRDSCRLRLRSDVPLATALSGGLDSSAIACTLVDLARHAAVTRAPADWQQAFVACFPGTSLDERAYAEEVVRHTGIRAHYETIEEGMALDVLERVIFDLEGIYWVPLVGPWGIYRAMRERGIRVSLDGHGADELLGGYHFFVERALDGVLTGGFDWRRYCDLKRVLAGLKSGSGQVTRAGISGDIAWFVKRELGHLRLLTPLREARRRLGRLRTAFGASAAGAMAAGGEISHAPSNGKLYREEADAELAGLPPLSAMLYSWFHRSVLPTILRSYDRASMAHGIEVRMPFMDWRLVSYAFALPEESKIGGGYTKRILRLAMQGLMPDSIRLRTNKIGFTTPLDQWARTSLATWFRDTTGNRDFLERDLWNGPLVREQTAAAVAGQGSVAQAWPVINAYCLEREFKMQARRLHREPAS